MSRIRVKPSECAYLSTERGIYSPLRSLDEPVWCGHILMFHPRSEIYDDLWNPDVDDLFDLGILFGYRSYEEVE